MEPDRATERLVLPVEFPRCICGARAVNDDALEQHKRRACIGKAGRLRASTWRPIYLWRRVA